MGLTDGELADIVSELSVVLAAGRLEKINSPAERTAQLVFRARGEERVLCLDFGFSGPVLHLQGKKRPGLPSPPAWVMKCRREIQNRFVREMFKPASDRQVWMRFEQVNRPTRWIVAEMFGRGRMLLLDEEKNILFPLIGPGEIGQAYCAPAPEGVAKERTSRFPPPDPETLACNRAVEEFFLSSHSGRELETRRREVLALVDRASKKITRKIKNLEEDFAKSSLGETWKQFGEAIKRNLSLLHKGQTRVELQDPIDPNAPAIGVELDPSKTPIENMQSYFAKGRRLASARPQIEKRMGQAQKELLEHETARSEMEQAKTIEDLESNLRKMRISTKGAKKEKTRKGPRRPYHSFVSSNGKSIWVGRSAKDNHELTFKAAKGSDLWLHVRDSSGAHVVVVLARDEPVDSETLLDAAMLAVHGSALKNSDRVDVTYALAKNVHPVKGAPPGLVSVAHGKTIHVRMDRERILNLLKSKE
jgi:predicted ribosome quality control (RQC) complex YloA/Tae2 family protein